MVLILEVSRPCQARPGRYRSPVLTRVWWLWFAVAWLHVSLRQYSETAYPWEGR